MRRSPPPHGAAALTRLVTLSTISTAAVERLLDAAFGADRRARTAYRLREGVEAIDALSFGALDADDRLIGSVQCWPVELAHRGAATPLVLVGPVAVAPDRQRGGLGRRITAAALAAADAAGHDAMMLIGDPEYYGRFFGFGAAPTAGWALPGPVERHRLLVRTAPGVALPSVAEVRPARVQLAAGLA